MSSHDANYESIPLSTPEEGAVGQLRHHQQLLTSRLPVARRVIPVLVCSLFIFNIFFTSSRSSNKIFAGENATKVLHQDGLATWRSADFKEVCIRILESHPCNSLKAKNRLCDLCIERLPCESTQGFCSTSSSSLRSPACKRCRRNFEKEGIARGPGMSTRSISSEGKQLPEFSPELEFVEMENEKIEIMTEPSAFSNERFGLLQLCQAMRDTEAFCLEETLDQQLCEPCSYCAMLRREKVCTKQDYPAMADCVECGIVSMS